MADSKITDLTDGDPAQSGDEIPINRSGADRKITAGSIASLAGASGQTPWTSDIDAAGFNLGFDDATGIEDDSGNEQLLFQKTAAAVNYLELQNSATGSGSVTFDQPTIRATGSDDHVGMQFEVKGNPSASYRFKLTGIGGDLSFPRLLMEAGEDAGGGPTLDMYWNYSAGSGSTGASGGHVVSNNDSNGTYYQSGSLAHYVVDRTASGQDGYWYFTSMVAGTKVTGLAISGDGTALENGPSNPPTWPGQGNLSIRTGKGLYDSSGNEQMLFTLTGSATNFWNVTNAATGTPPILAAAGSDTNISFKIAAKGGPSSGGELNVGTTAFADVVIKGGAAGSGGAGGGPGLTFNMDATSANGNYPGYIIFSGKNSSGTTVNMCELYCGLEDRTAGSVDAYFDFRPSNASLKNTEMLIGNGVTIGNLNWPGSGNLAIDDGFGIFDGAADEHLIFQSAGGSAVNHWEMTNTATGVAPILGAAGGDTDIGMTFTAKGAPATGATFNIGSVNYGGINIVGTGTGSGAVGGGPGINRTGSVNAAGNFVSFDAYRGRDSAANIQTYATTWIVLDDPTSGNEDAHYDFRPIVAGVQSTELLIGNGVAVGNETLPGSGKLRLTAIELGHDTDTSISRSSAGVLAIEGNPAASVNGMIRNFGITIDGGGSVITTGHKGFVVVPYACTITGWTVVGDQSGAIVVDVDKSTYAGFPTQSSIAGSEKPTLTGPAQKGQDLSLSTWTTAVTAGDVLGFEVESVSSVQRVHISIHARAS